MKSQMVTYWLYNEVYKGTGPNRWDLKGHPPRVAGASLEDIYTLYNSHIKMEIRIYMKFLIQSDFAGGVFSEAAGLIFS